MEEIYKKALNFFQKKQFKESKKLCKNILSNNPEEFKTMTTVGSELSNFHKAITTEE